MSDLDERVGDTSVTTADLALIGYYVLTSIATCNLMRHASPGGLLDYCQVDDDDPVQLHIVRDFIAWVARDEDDAARDRLLAYIYATGWVHATLGSLSSEAAA